MQTALSLFSTVGKGISGFAQSGLGQGLLSFGTSAVSAMSGYAMSQFKAGEYALAAGDERIAAGQDYLQAQQKANSIRLTYSRTVGAQQSAAAAGGIDIASGSVVEAQRQAQQEADRQLSASREGAQVDANLRRSRATMLDSAASLTRTNATTSLVSGLTGALSDFASIGGLTKKAA